VLFGRTESARSTFSEDILDGKVKRAYVDSFRHHTSLGWLASVALEAAGSGLAGLFHAAGLHDQSRAAFAEALIAHTGFEGKAPVQGYSPAGVPRNLALDMTRACAMLPCRPLDLVESLSLEYESPDIAGFR
jgi:dTDP-4-dehydrorhamnose reductase